ncbi:MAG: hypothetical protein A4E45_01047 [Methanosaeta sp. PtaB.Bin039]|nr:MAG: hypothetical protein A4E45_01047 [Methanosaeta sp. PtaB.Bin039]
MAAISLISQQREYAIWVVYSSIQADGQLIEMAEKPYDAEVMLQELLAKYPNLLAGDQIDDVIPRRWLLISREAPLTYDDSNSNRWAVDHLFLDQDAVPTLVEVKRSSNADVRRKVVGQMLDYAANAVVYWPVDEIKRIFESTCKAQNIDPDTAIRDFLDASDEPEMFWQRAKSNIEDGKIRMLFVADEIPGELRRIVEFLNSQMDRAEVLAVEIKQYTGQDLKSLIPRVIGKTEVATTKKESKAPSRQWDEDSFFQELESRKGLEASNIARKIYEWSKGKLPRPYWGNGRHDGSYFPILDHKDTSYYPIALWTYGKVEIQFQSLKTRPPFDSEVKRREFMDRLNQVPGINIAEDRITRRPNIPFSVFKDEAALRQFLETLDWAVREIMAS